MYRGRQRLEWPNRRLDPQEGRRRIWRQWFYDHLVPGHHGRVNFWLGSYYVLGSQNMRGW